MYTYEIYLTKKYIPKKEWLQFIQTISNYAGILKASQIIVVNNQNKLQYFLKINRQLPPTINGLDSFLLKSTTTLTEPKKSLTCPIIHSIDSNIIDLINYNEIKNKGNLIFLNIYLITFLQLYKFAYQDLYNIYCFFEYSIFSLELIYFVSLLIYNNQ